MSATGGQRRRRRSSRSTTSRSTSRSSRGSSIDREVGQRARGRRRDASASREGETLGLVGESGCGKTTLSRAIMRLIEPTDGLDPVRGQDVTTPAAGRCGRCAARCRWSSRTPSPRSTRASGSARSSATPLRLHGARPRASVDDRRCSELLERVGPRTPSTSTATRTSSPAASASGSAWRGRWRCEPKPDRARRAGLGARRVGAGADHQPARRPPGRLRASPTSSSPTTSSVVRHVSDRIAVMYLGKLMEVSPAEELYTKPIHPYTSALLAAIPIPDPRENRRRERVGGVGRAAQPDRPALGLRLPSALPARHRHLPRGGAAAGALSRAGTSPRATTR